MKELTRCLSKIIETVVSARLMWSLESLALGAFHTSLAQSLHVKVSKHPRDESENWITQSKTPLVRSGENPTDINQRKNENLHESSTAIKAQGN